MSETLTKETVEIAEPEVVVEAPKAPTREELKGKGWSAGELDAAEKRGMLQKPEEKKEAKPEAKEAPKAEEKPEPSAVDVDALVKAGVDLTPDQEREFLKKHPTGTPDSAFYHRAKNERKTRQRAQDDLQRERQERAAEKAAFEERLKALEAKREPELDENGNAIVPEDKPLTIKEFKALQDAERKKAEDAQKEQRERAQVVVEAQKTQEEYARSIYPDFDETVKRAAEVMQNLDALVPEKWKQVKVVKLIKEFQIAAANADKIDLDEYHAAHIAHEIGQFHPDHGKSNGAQPKETGKEKDPKANGGLTPEQMKRIEENNQRRASSASVPGGGGKRTVNVEDVGLAELNGMTYAERQKFREKHPDRYAKLLRG